MSVFYFYMNVGFIVHVSCHFGQMIFSSCNKEAEKWDVFVKRLNITCEFIHLPLVLNINNNSTQVCIVNFKTASIKL